jgi:transaldolase
VAEAFISGLEDRYARGEPVDGIASVASFFLSRIDLLVDPLIEKAIEKGGPEARYAAGCRGETAIASARMAYRIYKEIFSGERFRRMADRGARPQRVLWASTSTKNPEYSDVKYVDALIGPETVNTLPPETLEAYRDHGAPAPRLEDHLEEAECVLDRLPRLGIDIDRVTQQLEDEGIEKFNKPFDSLLSTLAAKRRTVLEGSGGRQAA